MDSRRLALRICLVVVLFGGVAACSGDDSAFQALLADPMAEYQPPGTELVRRSERPATGFLERGRSAPQILFEYRILESASPDWVFDETIALARSVGWEFEHDQPQTTATSNQRLEGAKDLGLLPTGKLVLSMNESDDEFGVRLTYPEAIP
ncbi:MAG: hypothetical protein ACRDZM_11100 [Acidimicrobiia bacterium]